MRDEKGEKCLPVTGKCFPLVVNDELHSVHTVKLQDSVRTFCKRSYIED